MLSRPHWRRSRSRQKSPSTFCRRRLLVALAVLATKSRRRQIAVDFDVSVDEPLDGVAEQIHNKSM